MAHRPPMILLDQVLGYDEAQITARVMITDASLFVAPEGVPGHLAIEYMAQTCGAYAGITALDAGEQVKIGFLLGTRNCRLLAPWFHVGDTLLISAALAYRDEQMAVFDCKIEIDGRLAADARLNVYQPDHDRLGDGRAGQR